MYDYTVGWQVPADGEWLLLLDSNAAEVAIHIREESCDGMEVVCEESDWGVVEVFPWLEAGQIVFITVEMAEAGPFWLHGELL